MTMIPVNHYITLTVIYTQIDQQANDHDRCKPLAYIAYITLTVIHRAVTESFREWINLPWHLLQVT